MVRNELCKILEAVTCIDVRKRADLEELQKEQSKLISIDKQLRALRKAVPEFASKCTEILRDLSLSVSVYLPKQKRLGTSYMLEAVENLKIHLTCIEAEVEPAQEYKEERKELFEQIDSVEITRLRFLRGCKTDRNGRKLEFECESEILAIRDEIFEKLMYLNAKILSKRYFAENNNILGVAAHV